MLKEKIPAILVLENGSVYKGSSFGYNSDSMGEVCFNTSMTGYQEILTDPSYAGQIITMTYPMIGNYGINEAYDQSSGVFASGFLVKEYVPLPSNFISRMPLADFLHAHKVPALEGIATRKLVIELRTVGAQRGGIFINKTYTPSLLEQVRASRKIAGVDLASEVSTKNEYIFGTTGTKKYKLAVLDFGVKRSILKLLFDAGFEVHVFPGETSYKELKAKGFHVYFLSNGPGDPEPLHYAIQTAKEILDANEPLLGICLGHQVIGLASGRETYKLKFGHRGDNQPVKIIHTGKVEITSQNHGFAVRDSEPGNSFKDVKVSHINLNDRTVEGFSRDGAPFMSIQYHPEASPGPNDSLHHFTDFYKLVDNHYRKSS